MITHINTLADFYAFWDKQDHTKHTDGDYAMRCILISILKNETFEQTLARLKRQFPPINSYDKWGTGEWTGRSKYDTLKSTLRLAAGHWNLRTFKNSSRAAFVNDLIIELIAALPDKSYLTTADTVERKPKKPYIRPDKDDIKPAIAA